MREIDKEFLEDCKAGEALEYIMELVKNGADVNAVENKDKELVKYLLENGANVDYQNFWGETALILACKGGMTEIVELLIPKFEEKK